MNSISREDNNITVKLQGSRVHPDACLINGGCVRSVNDNSAVDTFDDQYLTREKNLEVDLYSSAEYVEKIELVQVYVDKVKKIARPGCSQELLSVALNSVSSLAKILSVLSSKSLLNASL